MSRAAALETAGLTINTTLDLRYQEAAEAAVRSHVYRTDQAIGGLAMVKPGTGEVRALAQSRPACGSTRLRPANMVGSLRIAPAHTHAGFLAASRPPASSLSTIAHAPSEDGQVSR